MQTTNGTPLANTEATALQSDAPLGYFILPFLPIIGLFIFDGAVAEKVELGGLVVLTIFITALLEYVRRFQPDSYNRPTLLNKFSLYLQKCRIKNHTKDETKHENPRIIVFSLKNLCQL